MLLGAKMVRKTIDLLIEGKTDAVDQTQFIRPDSKLKSAPKIFKETCELSLTKTVTEAHNFVRGLSPYPAAWVQLQFPGQTDTTMLKVFETEKEIVNHSIEAGTVVTDGKKYAKVALTDGFLHLKQVQAPGKKRMEIGELLRGMRLN